MMRRAVFMALAVSYWTLPHVEAVSLDLPFGGSRDKDNRDNRDHRDKRANKDRKDRSRDDKLRDKRKDKRAEKKEEK